MPEANCRKSTGRATLLLMLLCAVAGCDGPFLMLPGGHLVGPEASLSEKAFPDAGVVELETRPDDPYSVHIGFTLVDGMLLVDPAEERRWYQNLRADPKVRVRFEGDPVVYAARVLPVTDPALIDRFEADRHVLQLVPR